MREIKINVGANLDAEGIQNALTPFNHDGDDTCPLHEVAYALMVERLDSRAEVHEVTIDDVFIDPICPSQVTISFTSDWSIYVGCHDMNDAGDQEECEIATYTDDGFLIFMVPVPRREANPC